MRKIYLLLLSLFVLTFCSDEEPSPSPTAYFSYNPTDLSTPCIVSFEDLSKNADNIIWDFDNGQTSIEENPSQLFEEGGYYNIKLRAINDVGHDEYTQRIFINQSTSYRVKNNSSFNLKYVSSFYDSSHYLLDKHEHGDLSINESSKILVTSRNNIHIIFKFNISDDYWALTANPFRIQIKHLNELILNDSIEIIPVTISSNKKTNKLDIITNSKNIRLKDIMNY